MLWPFVVHCSDNVDYVFLILYIIVYNTILTKCKLRYRIKKMRRSARQLVINNGLF